jgi:hypothetical protein
VHQEQINLIPAKESAACPGLLQAGYAVVFLTRTGSIQPFTQDLPLTETVPLLQSLLTSQGSSADEGSQHSYSLQEPAAGRVAGVLQKVEEVQRSQLLLTVPFTTIFEYLQVRGSHAWGVCWLPLLALPGQPRPYNRDENTAPLPKVGQVST